MNEMIRFIKGDFSTVPNKKALRGLSAVERSVYLSICDHADQDGVCFPSRGLLAKESSVSEKTVDRALKILVEKGFLDKKAVFTTTGGQTSNTYQMLIMSPGGDTRDIGGGDTTTTLTTPNINYTQLRNGETSFATLVKENTTVVSEPLEEEYTYEETDEDGYSKPKKAVKREPRNKLALNLVKEFSDLCYRYLRVRPVNDVKGYMLALNALNHLSVEDIITLFDEWFSSGLPNEELVHITRALSHNQINSFKIRHTHGE